MAYVNIPNEHHAVGGIQGKSLNNSTMFGVCVYMMCILDIIFSSYSIHCIRSIRVYTVFALQISVVTFRYTPQKTNTDTPNPHSLPGKILFQTIIFRFNFCDLHGLNFGPEISNWLDSWTPTEVEVTTPGIRGHLPHGWRPMHLGFQTTGLGEHVEFSVDGGVSRCTWMHHLNSTKSTLAYADSSPTFNKSVYCNESRYFVGKAGKPFSIHLRLDIWQW